MDDSFSRAGAARLANRIRLYWWERGIEGVNVWIEPFVSVQDGSQLNLYHIRSNIVERLDALSIDRNPVLQRSTA